MTIRAAIMTLGLLAGMATAARAQRVSIETLVDLEGWKTDDSSRLLARNNGDAFGLARLHLWGGLRLARTVQVLALGEFEASTERGSDPEAELELLELRFTPSRTLVIGTGRILMPMGLFGARRFSHVNPVIGAPDLYPTQYPWGVNVSGAVGDVDYHAGVGSLPVVNTRYTPEPSEKARPIAGLGVSVGPSLHLGIAGTHGPYLNRNVQASLPPGSSWDDYDQTVVSANARVSFGYVETRAELAWSRYEAPTVAEPVHGLGVYAEARVTLSPRVFVGLRLEHFDYAFIQTFAPGVWTASQTLERNAELGVGYRFSQSLLVKASFRKDSWPGPSPPGANLVDGYAAAIQFSWHAYPLELLGGRY
jgi:hypothetical protein